MTGISGAVQSTSTVASAVVVTGNRITAVLDDDSEAEAFRGPDTEVIDLGGAPEGDWVLTEDTNGNPLAVRSTGFDTLAREVLCF